MNSILSVSEIFTSIDGEVNRWGQGCFSTFVRLSGCPIRCSYCDTPQALAFNQGQPMTVAAVVEAVRATGCPKVTITGGEPLFHPNFSALLHGLLSIDGMCVSIETNGTILPECCDYLDGGDDVNWVFDYKLPSSGMKEHRLSDRAFAYDLPLRSWIKFVVSTEEDFDEALAMVGFLEKRYDLEGGDGPRLAFSPCMGTPGSITPEDLVSRLIDRKLFHVVVNCQIHKFLFQGGEGFRKVIGK